MGAISDAARQEISSRSGGSPQAALATPSKLMVGDAKPERFLRAMDAEARAELARLLVDPFVARVEVEWLASGARQTYYFARRSAVGLTRAVKNASFVASGAALGALAEHEAGETATIEINGTERRGRVLKRTVLSPTLNEGLWDAFLNSFEIERWDEIIELLRAASLRLGIEKLRRDVSGPVEVEDIVGRLLAEAADAQLERGRLRRKVVERIELRDRPVMDKFQGEIFRLPLDRQVILFGPPGSGKTTTLIKRLAQKRTLDAITDREEALVSTYARERFIRPDNWAMFSPTELLKEYLGGAFSKEGVPDSGNVRTWDKERHDLARNVFNILRSGSSGRYQRDDRPFLADPSSSAIAALHDDFATYVESTVLKRCDDALAGLRSARSDGIKRQVSALTSALGADGKFAMADVMRFLDEADGLQGEIKIVTDLISVELNKTVNLLLNTNSGLLDELVRVLPTLRGEEEEDGVEDVDDAAPTVPPGTKPEALNMLMTAIRNWARAVSEGGRSPGGRSGRVIALLEGKLPPRDSFKGLGENIGLRARLRTLVQAPRMSVLGIPAMYARFRRQATIEGSHFVQGERAVQSLSRNLISPDEIDVLLLVMLRNARRLSRYAESRRIDLATRHDWLATIQSRHLIQVFVDEATDLSAVQLACTVELADPALRSWFACGDLRQRITSHGIRNDADIEWLNRTAEIEVDVRTINIGYRQSRRLRELSDALAVLLDDVERPETQAAKGSEEANARPLLGERLAGKLLAKWLAKRIEEVEDSIGRLPSIAIFVDGDALIDPLVEDLRPILAERNIPIAGCKEGKVVGDLREVRVFDVQHIKGLEFEAVFFVGIDGLAARIPDLFSRFFYVGVTRAATYLGLTSEEMLPAGLEPLRPHFGADGWQVE
jgi:UvrD-like helicase C-terminal domain